MLNFYRLKRDYLKFEGSERLDLINRLSTNHVNSLAVNNGIKTVLTSDKGRIVDVLTLYNFGDFIFSTCSFNNSKNVLAHLDKYTIMDDFRPVDMPESHNSILFFGDEASGFAKQIFNCDITNLVNNDFIFYNDGSRHSIIANNDDAFDGFLFIYSAEDKDFWENKVFSHKNLKEISGTEFEPARIKLGIPEFGAEMSGLTNPLECGLNKYVSFTKGCYIGQEVIARLDAYDKISKHMVGFITNSELPAADDIKEYKISQDNKECGFVTSYARTPENEFIGLGFIKTIFLDYSKTYRIKTETSTADCTIVNLPFSKN